MHALRNGCSARRRSPIGCALVGIPIRRYAPNVRLLRSAGCSLSVTADVRAKGSSADVPDNRPLSDRFTEPFILIVQGSGVRLIRWGVSPWRMAKLLVDEAIGQDAPGDWPERCQWCRELLLVWRLEASGCQVLYLQDSTCGGR